MNVNSNLITKILDGNRVAVAKGISLVENEHPEAMALLKSLFPRTGRAYRIGVTGPPVAGKSTLSNKLAKYYRGLNFKVGIIAVDPTSPFTGGALLGDRVRMTDVELDPGVFIRSMASRGSLGGLSKKAKEAADVLDASGFDLILMETVGVGQSELDIARAADTTIVVLVPESGDSIQAMKAGLMEIADFYVINKADRAGADQAVMSIKTALSLKNPESGWTPDVIKTVANNNTGISDVAAMIGTHRNHLESTGQMISRRRERIAERVRDLISERFRMQFWTDDREKFLSDSLNAVLNHHHTPYDVVDELTKGLPFKDIAIR